MRDYSEQMAEAKAAYLDLLVGILGDIKTIDNKTPWQETEPNWWLDMMEIGPLIQKCLRQATKND